MTFYDAVMKTLGFRRVFTSDKAAGWGIENDKDQFAIKKRVERTQQPSPGFHLAFGANDRAAVDAFHAAALANGAKDNGAPGLRPHYGPEYYAAFVIDPDGYELEAVVRS